MTEKKVTPPDEVAALKAEVERLSGLLAQAKDDGIEAAKRAMFFRDDNEEIATGKTVTVTKCTHFTNHGHTDEGIPIRRPVFAEVEVPTFLYKIDLPPVGGIQVLVNGNSFYHDETYELDLDTLRSVKEMVYRIREHEANIHGSDENSYRPKVNAQFSGKVGGRVH